MKYRLIVGLIVFSIFSLGHVWAAECDSVRLGNSTGNGVSMASSKVKGGALYLPASSMQLYAGNMLTDIYLYTVAPAQTKGCELFVTDNLEGPFLYKQAVVLEKVGWNRIKLTEPFQLDGKALYIGFVLEEGMISYALRNSEGKEYVYENGAWNLYDGIYSLAFYGVVKGDNLPRYNADWTCRKPVEYVRTGVPFAIDGTVVNKGIETIHSLTFRYIWENGEQTETIENLDIAYLDNASVTLKGPQLPESGKYSLQVDLTEVNGQADLDLSDNHSDVFSLFCLDEFVPRNLLLEVFSTEACTNCPAGHKKIDAAVEERDRIIEIGHHAAYGKDKFTIDASQEYEWFYNGSLYTPSLLLDRTDYYARYPEAYPYGNISPVCGVDDCLPTMLDEALDVPAFVSLDLTVSCASEDSYRNVTVTVKGDKLLDMFENDHSYRLTVFLTEDSLYSETQRGASGGYYHRHVARECLTESWGDEIDVQNGFEKEYKFQVPVEWNMKRMQAVAFVSEYNAQDRYACRVYNSASASLKTLIPVGLDGAQVVQPLSAYLKERTLFLPEGIGQLSLYDMCGNCLFDGKVSGQSVSLQHLPSGVYLYCMFSGETRNVGKIVLD